MERKRKVLLLGNGINLSFNGTAWKQLLEGISVRKDFDLNKLESPMPLQAVLLTNNNLKEAMKNCSDTFFGKVTNPQHRELLQSLLATGFDDILTTNYSYELEEAALGIEKITKHRLQKVSHRTGKKDERRYLLHMYNQVSFGGKETRIWHIHGESRMSDSMVLGHYWYGNLLGRINEDLKRGKNQYYRLQREGKQIAYDSWIDSFLLGDVFVLGFSFDLSEMDLWWLLNRRHREKAEKGKLIFYEMENPKKREKTELMKLFDAEIESFGCVEPEKEDPDGTRKYLEFYQKAIDDIRSKV